MPLYEYRCEGCLELVDLFHPMDELHQDRTCPHCGGALRRHLTPVHHRWPAQYRPGMEDSGQRMFLDPEFQARKRDELAEKKAAHVKRTAQEG